MPTAAANPPVSSTGRKSRVKAATRKLRELAIVGHALVSTHHM